MLICVIIEVNFLFLELFVGVGFLYMNISFDFKEFGDECIGYIYFIYLVYIYYIIFNWVWLGFLFGFRLSFNFYLINYVN